MAQTITVMAWPHGAEADIDWPTEVGLAIQYGRSLVTTVLIDSIERPSDEILAWLNLAADAKFDWST